jgi:uncharacterized protein (TIGR03643 family)
MLSAEAIDRIIEMAWEDRTPLEAIEAQFGLREDAVVDLMRQQLAPAAWRRWRKRVNGRATKFARKRDGSVSRFKCDRQRLVSGNRISKR